MARHQPVRQTSLPAVIDHGGEWHRRRKHSRAGLGLHVRSEGSKASACLRLYASSSSMLRLKVEGTAGGIAGSRRNKLDFWYAELDFLGRRRAPEGRRIVVEGEGSLSGRAVSVLEVGSDSHDSANKGSRVARRQRR